MKRILVVLTVVFSISLVFSQTVEKSPACKAMAGYMMALKSENPGLRLNAIYQIAQLRSVQVQSDFSNCLKELEKVAKNDKNTLVKVHASLAMVYLQDDSLSQKVKMVYKEEPTEFFKRVYNEMQSVQVASN